MVLSLETVVNGKPHSVRIVEVKNPLGISGGFVWLIFTNCWVTKNLGTRGHVRSIALTAGRRKIYAQDRRHQDKNEAQGVREGTAQTAGRTLPFAGSGG